MGCDIQPQLVEESKHVLPEPHKPVDVALTPMVSEALDQLAGRSFVEDLPRDLYQKYSRLLPARLMLHLLEHFCSNAVHD